MPLTPQITLTFNLLDDQNNQIGSAGNPAYILIVLCNYGPFLPKISGTGMIAKIVQKIPYVGISQNIALFGNDVIAPPGTYYAITLLDDQGNVLQCGAYVFNGVVNADFSTLSPTFPTFLPQASGITYLVAPFAAGLNFLTGSGPSTFDITLTGNVTSFVLIAPFSGAIVTFIIQQDATGARTWTWPSNVKNAGVVDADPNSITTQSFVVRADGNLYPLGPQTYS